MVEAEAGRRALPNDHREGGRGEAPQPHGLQELGLDNLGGIFVVTFSGVALACVACVVELLCVTYQVPIVSS